MHTKKCGVCGRHLGCHVVKPMHISCMLSYHYNCVTSLMDNSVLMRSYAKSKCAMCQRQPDYVLGYKCEICLDVRDTLKNLIRHMKCRHNDRRPEKNILTVTKSDHQSKEKRQAKYQALCDDAISTSLGLDRGSLNDLVAPHNELIIDEIDLTSETEGSESYEIHGAQFSTTTPRRPNNPTTLRKLRRNILQDESTDTANTSKHGASSSSRDQPALAKCVQTSNKPLVTTENSPAYGRIRSKAGQLPNNTKSLKKTIKYSTLSGVDGTQIWKKKEVFSLEVNSTTESGIGSFSRDKNHWYELMPYAEDSNDST